MTNEDENVHGSAITRQQWLRRRRRLFVHITEIHRHRWTHFAQQDQTVPSGADSGSQGEDTMTISGRHFRLKGERIIPLTLDAEEVMHIIINGNDGEASTAHFEEAWQEGIAFGFLPTRKDLRSDGD
jgi:hypothetical protein